ncbi:MAG: hypothetical protein AB8F74_16860 [Saprospiraceae bacterium]
MLKTNIFAGGITNLTDARYFAARGAQYLSFNLDNGASLNISPEKMAAIKEWVEGPSFIGTFQIATADEIAFLIERLDLQLIQIGPFISIETLAEKNISIPIIKEIVIEDLNTLVENFKTEEKLFQSFDFIFLNFEKNGLTWSAIKESSIVFDLLKNWKLNSKLVLAIAHEPSETEEILAQINPHGLYLQGGEEEKVGFKSYEDLDEILDVLETEDW